MVEKYTIKNEFIELTILNIGASIYELKYNGENVVLSYSNIDDYLDNELYLGCIVGRSAGRIKEPQNDILHLDKNFLDKYNLHGNYIHRANFNIEVSKNKIKCSYLDEAGAFPGDCLIVVEYELIKNKLKQTITSSSDVPSIHNFTNHTYFNLGYDSILEHDLKIEASKVWEIDEEYLPTRLIDVADTGFDFRNLTNIKQNYKKGHKQFSYSKFIDNPYLLEGSIELVGKNIKMDVFTNREYVVCYTGNFLSESSKKINLKKDIHASICLETQKIPGDLTFVSNDKSITEFVFNTKVDCN